MLEQRYIIKFLVKEQDGPKEIHYRLKTVYGDRAMKGTQVYWLILEVQRWYEYVSDFPRPGRHDQLELTRSWFTGLSMIDMR
jgi:hypothetical protein